MAGQSFKGLYNLIKFYNQDVLINPTLKDGKFINLDIKFGKYKISFRERNKTYNQEAYLHIPDNWYEHDYKELLDIFNLDSKERKLSREGIILVTQSNPLKVIVKLV